MLIGELAKHVGTSIDTIRYYEREGLIKPIHRRNSGYREFDGLAIERLNFILRAKKLGFTLKQIKELLMLNENPDTTCSNVRDLAEHKLDEVKVKIKTLQRIEKQLQKLVIECCSANDKNCPIIKNLNEEDIK